MLAARSRRDFSLLDFSERARRGGLGHIAFRQMARWSEPA